MSMYKDIKIVFWENRGMALDFGDWRALYGQHNLSDDLSNEIKRAAFDYFQNIRRLELFRHGSVATEQGGNVIYKNTNPNAISEKVYSRSDIQSLLNEHEKDETFSTGWYNIDCFIERLYDLEHNLIQKKREDICR